MVFIEGLVGAGTPSAGPTGTVFTLPVGFRPEETIMFASVGNNAFGRLDVMDDGSVRAVSGNGTYFSITCCFYVAPNAS